jgi:MFS family permease
VFAVVAGAALLGALLVALLAREVREAQPADAPRASFLALMAAAQDDLRRLLRVPKLREALILYAAVQFALGATNPLMEFLVEAVWSGDRARIEGLTGTLFSALALSAIVATPLWGRWADRIGAAPVLRVSSALSALALVAHALAPAYGWLLAVRILFGLASPGASASAFSLAATETESGNRGAAMGAVFSARSFAVSAGAFAAGSLAAALGIRGLFAAAGAVIGAGLLLGRRASEARALT